MKKILNFFVDNAMLTNWLMLVILVAGGFGVVNLKMRIWPKVELTTIQIDIPYPGASALEVEEGLIIKIEENLKGLEGLEGMDSSSMDGYGSITLSMSSSVSMSKSLDKVRNMVNSIREYPAGAEKPVIFQNTFWNRAMMVTIYGPDDMTVLTEIA
ncbi:MAG: efflux RND transporter permease subunit, partial [Proteobacteria bacterium]|nr:efflux RND transporter permease subunit [Pseudomonadota bacterium]